MYSSLTISPSARSVTRALFHAWKVVSLATQGVPRVAAAIEGRDPSHAVATAVASSSGRRVALAEENNHQI